jgi:hypothetical protein
MNLYRRVRGSETDFEADCLCESCRIIRARFEREEFVRWVRKHMTVSKKEAPR